LRGSPYDALLEQLAAAGPGKGLKFGDVKARASVTVRARKKGMRVSFAVAGDVLYVRFDGRVEDDVHGGRRAAILTALRRGPANPITLAVILRANGDANLDGETVVVILAQMARTGEVVRGEGDRWALNPVKKAA